MQESTSYWLHRISYHAEISHIFLDKYRYLTIGFSDYANEEFLDNLQAKDEGEA